MCNMLKGWKFWLVLAIVFAVLAVMSGCAALAVVDVAIPALDKASQPRCEGPGCPKRG